jgi:hypothetical protein
MAVLTVCWAAQHMLHCLFIFSLKVGACLFVSSLDVGACLVICAYPFVGRWGVACANSTMYQCEMAASLLLV